MRNRVMAFFLELGQDATATGSKALIAYVEDRGITVAGCLRWWRTSLNYPEPVADCFTALTADIGSDVRTAAAKDPAAPRP
ncbi:hypothetical protein [Streptomyces spectabilis]|uniref:Uncharacterized protein n=1 Tax=Streptomyces spectabilis TaxID=68270 RepID=A0A7W8B494_STRST|nr:hypothetical protein [Streptomyces spectabilis]MBB5109667.1 hypothetical protein [Streptomyces spectabilis]